MVRRLQDRLKFLLERWIQRGPLQQLLLMAALVASVAVAGGLLAWGLTDAFANPAVAIWWAFLRLTDPGYLGDDEGAMLRSISTVVTVLGYVLFMGSLIAILTQWLNLILRTLESGLTPISMQGHFLILGWTNRTPSIVRELVLSENRVQWFLRRRGTKKLRIVVLAEEVDAVRRQELREMLGNAARHGQIYLRSGSSMRIEHLRRVDFARAAAILLPGADYEMGGPEGMDSRIIKTLMSITRYGAPQQQAAPPVVVAEIYDADKRMVVEHTYRGPLHVLAGDAFISRLVAQNVRHRGLSHVYAELLSHTYGNEVYVRAWPTLAGVPFGNLSAVFPEAVVLGLVRPDGHAFEPLLNPSADVVLSAEDRVVLMANSYADTAPQADPAPLLEAGATAVAPTSPKTRSRRRLLVLGWSHKVSALMREFGSYPNERFEIDVFSVIPAAEREAALLRIVAEADRVAVRHLEGDYTIQADMQRLQPETYDNIVFLGSDWLRSSEETDARTILGYALLRAVLPPGVPGPDVVIELKDPANERLFEERFGEVILSPVILSHMLAHAALRPELTSVFNELFGPGGAEIFFRPAQGYDLPAGAVTFRQVQQAVAARGEIALGIRQHGAAANSHGGVMLNPPRAARYTLGPADEVVVLTHYD